MSSTYAPQPFSYLAGGSQAPKTGLRRDESLYGSRRDMAQPIPALRHDQPRFAGDWSIDQRLRGGDSSPKPAERRRVTPQDSGGGGDTESTLSSYSNIRLPRPDVSLYQSQIARPTVAAAALQVDDTPSGHYSNRSPTDVDNVGMHVDDKPPPTAAKPHAVGGVFDNFILMGPGRTTTDAAAAARRTSEDERPTPASRLEQLFGDHPSSSSDVASSRRRDSDTNGTPRPAAYSTENSGGDDSTQLPCSADEMTTSSYIVTASASRTTSFGIGDTKFMRRSSSTDSVTGCTACCCCCGGRSAVYCSRCRLCVLVVIAVIVALLMFGVGFVAGWFAHHLHGQQALGYPAAEGNATASTRPGQNESFPMTREQTHTANVTATTITSSRATTMSTATSTSTSASQLVSSTSTIMPIPTTTTSTTRPIPTTTTSTTKSTTTVTTTGINSTSPENDSTSQ